MVLIVEFVVHQLLCRRESITVVLGAVMFIGSYPSSFKLLSEFKLQETFPFLNRTWNSNHHLWLPTVPADYRITFQAPGLSCPPLPEVFLVVSICVYSYCWTEQDLFLFSFLMNTSSWVIQANSWLNGWRWLHSDVLLDCKRKDLRVGTSCGLIIGWYYCRPDWCLSVRMLWWQAEASDFITLGTEHL